MQAQCIRPFQPAWQDHILQGELCQFASESDCISVKSRNYLETESLSEAMVHLDAAGVRWFRKWRLCWAALSFCFFHGDLRAATPALSRRVVVAAPSAALISGGKLPLTVGASRSRKNKID